MTTKMIKPMKGFVLYFILAFGILTGLTLPAGAGMQSVVISPQNVTAAPGKTIEFVLTYDVTEGEEQTTGLGLRIHYNSNVVALIDLQETFEEGLIAQDNIPHNDTADFDNDPDTDRYIGVAWAGLVNGWPGSVDLPVTLIRMSIQIRGDSKTNKAPINITSSSVPAGYGFDSQSAAISVP